MNLNGVEKRGYLDSQTDDLYLCTRPFLGLGRVLAIIPQEGVFGRELSNVKFRKYSFAAIISVLFVLILFLPNSVIGLYCLLRTAGGSTSDFAWAWEGFLLYSTSVFVYIYFNWEGHLLMKLYSKWQNLTMFYSRVDTKLFRDICFISAVIFTSAVLENIVFNVQSYDSENFDEFFKKFYRKSRTYWPKLVPYNGVIVALVFIANKFATYCPNYVDIFIIIVSRALSVKFSFLEEESRKKLITGPTQITKNKDEWKKLASDHESLCQLVKEFERFFSPLIFISYLFNIYYICLQLHLGLTSSAKRRFVTETLYALWSFFHFVARVFFVTLFAARINTNAHRISRILDLCPLEATSFETDKMGRYLSMNTIGFTGLGCFIITKPLMLKIVGVVLTFEIVLLQAAVPLSVHGVV